MFGLMKVKLTDGNELWKNGKQLIEETAKEHL